MDMQIYFPNLGIYLEHVGKSFHVFGFEVAFYGCTMALGILFGYLLAEKEAKRTGQNPDNYMDMILYAVFFALVGARLYYVIFKWDYYGQNLMQIFNVHVGLAFLFACLLVFLMVSSKRLKLFSINLERKFQYNLNSRDYE